MTRRKPARVATWQIKDRRGAVVGVYANMTRAQALDEAAAYAGHKSRKSAKAWHGAPAGYSAKEVKSARVRAANPPKKKAKRTKAKRTTKAPKKRKNPKRAYPKRVRVGTAGRTRASRPRARRANGPMAAQAHEHYRELHWGDGGTGNMQVFDVPDTKRPLAVLGRLEKCAYITRKGEGRPVEAFDHAFRHPVFLLVDANGDLVIGTIPGKRRYIVTKAGIVG
jgi:hypothetical protein